MRSSRMFQLSDVHLSSTVRVEALRLWRDDAGAVMGRFSVTVHSGIALSCRFELDTPVSAAARFADRALEWLASKVPPDDGAGGSGSGADGERRVVAEFAPGRSQPQLRLHPYYRVTANVDDAAFTLAEILEPERERSTELLRAFRRYLDTADAMVEAEPAFTPLRLRSGDGRTEVSVTPEGPAPSEEDADLPCRIDVRTASGVSGSFWPVVSVFSVREDFVLPALAGLDQPGRRTSDGGPYWYPFEYSRSTSLYLRLEADHWIVSVSPGLGQGAEELELTLRDPDVAGLRAALLVWRDALADLD